MDDVLTYKGLEHFKEKNDETYSYKPTKRTAILSVDSWIGEVAPYRIDVAVDGVTEKTDVQIVPNYTWSDDEVHMWMDAQIISGETSDGKISLKAYGAKPSTDIPIMLLIGSEIL